MERNSDGKQEMELIFGSGVGKKGLMWGKGGVEVGGKEVCDSKMENK